MESAYKNTLNLPRTDFGMKADLARKEPLFLKRWEEMDLYGRIRESRRESPPYILHDGPPYPTGDLHIGTGMNKILKDIIVRFHNMKNYRTPFIPGWDCHGLPIEHKVLSLLGKEANELSDERIRERCRRFALKYVDANRRQFKSLGCLGDWDNPYLTINPAYEAGVIRVFQKLVEKGYVYRQLKPIHWCYSCRTALAEAELEYAERKDISIYVEFPLIPAEPEAELPLSILIWTTTPWTLPANLAVAVHPDFEYALLEGPHPTGNGSRRIIMAAAAVERVAAETGFKDYRLLKKFRGRELTGRRYRHPWFDREGLIVPADYVNLEEGTGCVHTAPGHGADDFITGQKNNLAVFSPVDEDGCFTGEVEELEGEHVFAANEAIVTKLDQRGLLWGQREITHSYPHCWRCHQPVIFRATQQWFISLENHDLRKRALEEVDKVKWFPDWGYNRIRAMLEQRPDWCISRQRKWGIPIPAFYCERCGRPLLEGKVIGHIEKLFARRGSDCWFQLPVAELMPEETTCPACGNSTFRKENDIFDVWFESGSSHRSVLMKRPELRFPADLYLEGSDQHRGWFQLSLLLSTAAEDQAPFREVLTHGFVVDERGEKMSKSRGNFISIEQALKRFPADILRLWFASVDYRRDIHVSYNLINQIAAAYRKFRNTFKHILSNLYDFNPARDSIPFPDLTEIDRWALLELEGLRGRVEEAYRDFEFHKVYREVYNFCVLEMSSFYLDILKDRLYTHPADSRERRSTQTALGEILITLTQLLAPILSFTTEEIWGHLRERWPLEESVHLSLWPAARPEREDRELKENWDQLLAVRSQVLKLLEVFREDGRIGNSLEARVKLLVNSPDLARLLRRYEKILPTIFITSQVELELVPAGEPLPGTATDLEGLGVILSKAEGEKCARCWKYDRSVGSTPDHPGLCRQCVEYIRS